MRSLLLLAAACGAPFDGAEKFDDYSGRGARILFVGAHPDDETLAGPLLGHACATLGNECHLAIFTRGEGGSCRPEGCELHLAETRSGEMERAAAGYRAALHLSDFPNHASEIATDPTKRSEIRSAWEAHGDVRAFLDAALDASRPDVVITFDPDHGFTGHLEHQIASELVDEAIATRDPDRSPAAVFRVLNRFRDIEGLTGLDPELPTERWDLLRACGDQSCLDFTADVARVHESQTTSILGLFLLFKESFEVLYLGHHPRE